MRPRTFRFYFVFASDELTEQSRSQLPAILASIRRFPAPEVAVNGHTDPVGPAVLTAALGLERAEASRDGPIAGGIEPAPLRVTSHGQAKPGETTPADVAAPRQHPTHR